MDYDLTRLGSREFEHLTQALAIRVIGNGVSIFGDGRDGGREAVFHGRIAFPDPDPRGPWNGYGVLQSKFRIRPLGTKSDTAWFLSEIRRELGKWGDHLSARAKSGKLPEYLVLATNVVLSSVADSGGIDRVEECIKELVTKYNLPLRGWKVWHYDQIRTFLDLYPEVRQPYEAMVTSGDVLAQVRNTLQLLDNQKPQATVDATLSEDSDVVDGIFSTKTAKLLELHHELHDTPATATFFKTILGKAFKAQGASFESNPTDPFSITVKGQRWILKATQERTRGDVFLPKLSETSRLREVQTSEECAKYVRSHLAGEMEKFDRIILLRSEERFRGFTYRLMEIPKKLLECAIEQVDASKFRKGRFTFFGDFEHPHTRTRLLTMRCDASVEKIGVTIPTRYCIQHASWLVRPSFTTG